LKKKILVIIAAIMIISTIIRTLIVGISFLNFSNALMENQSNLIKEILQEVEDKERFINIIKESHHIKEIEFVKHKNLLNSTISYNFHNKTITVFMPFNDSEYLKIVFSGEDYFSKLQNAIIQLIIIALISLIIIILIVNYFLTPYLEILEKVKNSTENILKGNFDQKIDTTLKGEAKEFVDSYNEFLTKLKNSFGVIEEKYTSLIEKEKSEDPLNDAKETIEQLANIFKFKRLIEEDLNYEIILERLIEVIKAFQIKHFALIGIDNGSKEAFYIYTEGDICCDIAQNTSICRAYRLKKEINSLKFEHICAFHTCKEDYICLPFSTNGNFTGILKIIIENNKEEINHILPYLRAYLNEVSSIIESKYTLELLHNQNIKDPLTGLFNRRYLENILTHIIANAKRRDSKVGFLMLDIDFFKQVNDTYGHDVGDIILKEIAQIIKQSIRESDVPIRFGGEEFLVILTNLKNKDDLKVVAEKLRNNIKAHQFLINDNSISIQKTVSIGGALFPEDCEGMDCIKKADIALYEAKKNGRDQVVIYSKELENS